MARSQPFPLSPEDFLTERRGQVAGLGGGNLKIILKENAIEQKLASEGGRTSRGNRGLMKKYAVFLNELHAKEPIDFNDAEAFWAGQIIAFFRNQPFVLPTDPSKTIRACFDDLFEQAKKRQRQYTGTQYLGAVLQHLVGAKLAVAKVKMQMHGASAADSPADRGGDFEVNNSIIHCTTAPAEALLQSEHHFWALSNRNNNFRPRENSAGFGNRRLLGRAG
jgi:hypothetical protein